MQEQEIRNILDSVRSGQTESRTFEAKTASEGCPKKIYDTLSSFSNQDEGGVIMQYSDTCSLTHRYEVPIRL